MSKKVNSNPKNRVSQDSLSEVSKKYIGTYKLSPKYQALKITCIYFLIGSLWILLSDKLVEFLIKERSIILVISIVKGWIYVFITSILIFLLIFTAMRKFKDSKDKIEKMNDELEEKNDMLDKSNTLFSAILESSPQVIIFALDSNYCYLAFNSKHKDTIQQIWGKEIKIGMNMLDVIGRHQDRNKAKANFDRALAGESFTLTEEYGDEMFSRLFWQDYYSPVFSNDGKVIGLTCFVLNITDRKQTEEALYESERSKSVLLSNLPGMSYRCLNDSEWTMEFVSEGCYGLTGYKPTELLYNHSLSYNDIILPEDREYVRKTVEKAVCSREPVRIEYRICTANQKEKWVWEQGVSVYDAEGKVEALEGLIVDITDRKKLEVALANEKKLLETTLISVGDGVISTDNMGNIVFLNKVAEFLTGWTQEAAREKSIEEVFDIVNELTHEKSENIVKKVLESGQILEIANHTLLISKDGTERPIEDSAAPIVQENGEIVGVVLVFRDFSEKKQKQEKIEFLSYHDQLTGLYNRRFYEEELKRLDTEGNLPLTLVMGDVNGLKLINDSFGHALGDEVLKKAAEVIMKGFRTDDIIARLGGDEFVILLPKTDAFEAEQIIKRIIDMSIKEKVGSMDISISFGCETKNNPEEKIQEIFKNAEDHMYKKKLFESPSMRSKTIKAIINTLHEKNKREEQHSHRVSALCKSMGENLGLPEHEIEELKSVGLLHDIGKIAIDENILNKTGRLTDDEWKEIKRHPEIGYRILSTVNDMSDMANYVLYHHERWDGKGYPKGLKGEEIPFVSRIITIADAYDAMASERSYRSALSDEVVIAELQKNAGIQFDPELLSVFIEKVLEKKY